MPVNRFVTRSHKLLRMSRLLVDSVRCLIGARSVRASTDLVDNGDELSVLRDIWRIFTAVGAVLCARPLR